MRRLWLIAVWLAAATAITPAQGRGPLLLSLNAPGTDVLGLRRADSVVTVLRRSGQLNEVSLDADRDRPGVEHRRLQQYQNGVPVWGSTLTVQEYNGAPVSVFGGVYQGLETLDTDATLSADAARAVVATRAGVAVGPFTPAPLYIRADLSTGARLVYAIRATRPNLLRTLYFVDAHTGDIVEERIDTKTVVAVGTGTGVLKDRKKVSASTLGGLFVLVDELRPTPIETYDLRGDSEAATAILNGTRPFLASDLGSDTDNVWTDPALVDAHYYSGLTYDYLFKRFGRLGLDNKGLPIRNIVHPVFRTEINRFLSQVGVVSDTPQEVPDFFVNAGYMGNGIAVYGDGLPPGFVLVTPNADVTVDYLSGAIDIVAHELTHGVTEFTSNLEFRNESGALQESFSDIIGASVEFFFQQPGSGKGRADYTIAEDILSTPARSLASPRSLSQPDNYRDRFTGTGDNGGVHINSGIPNNAFYLAIEGGTNSTSGIAVTGVGAARREQIERVFYRAFTQLLPANATFSTARAATIQSAIDLYGAGSAAAAAVDLAWTAVGVQ